MQKIVYGRLRTSRLKARNRLAANLRARQNRNGISARNLIVNGAGRNNFLRDGQRIVVGRIVRQLQKLGYLERGKSAEEEPCYNRENCLGAQICPVAPPVLYKTNRDNSIRFETSDPGGLVM